MQLALFRKSTLVFIVFLQLLGNGFLATAQQLNFSRYTVAEGLPDLQVCDLLEDKRGSMWIGTENGGLCRYNGRTFTVYTTKDGLSDNTVKRIVQARDGTLWLFGKQGITHYDGFRFRAVQLNLSAQGLSLKDAFEDLDQDNVFWLSFRHKSGFGVKVYKFHQGKLQKLQWDNEGKYKHKLIVGISQNIDGSLMLSAPDGSLDFDYTRKLLEPSFIYKQTNWQQDYGVIRLAKDTRKRTWYKVIGAEGKLQYFVEDKDVFTAVALPQPLYSQWLASVSADIEGNLWFSTMDALYKCNTDTCIRYKKNLGLNGVHATRVLQDNEGNKWIATFGLGLIRFADDGFMHYGVENGLPTTVVNRLFEDKKNRLWFSLINGKVGRISTEGLKIYDTPKTEKANRVKYMYENKDGKLVMVTTWAVFVLQADRFVETKTELNLPDVTQVGFRSVALAGDTLWAFTQKYGLIKYYDGKFSYWNKHNSGLNTQFVHNISVLNNGHIWLNAQDACIRFDGKEFTEFSTVGSVPIKTFAQVVERENGDIWAASIGGGLYRIRGDEAKVYTRANSNLPSDIIATISMSDDNTLWLGTVSGVTQVLLNTEGELDTLYNYDKYDGFMGGQAYQEAILTAHDERVWFGTMNGLTVFDPTRKKQKLPPPHLSITHVRLQYEKTDWTKPAYRDSYDSIASWYNLPINLRLQNDQNHLVFKFEAISHSTPEKVVYKWKLEGFDTDWGPVTNRRSAAYVNLAPGKYTFKVMAANRNGVWTKTPEYFSFQIVPAVWQTLWFKVLIFGLLVIMAYGLMRAREVSLIKERDKLEKKVRHRTSKLKQQNDEMEAQRDEIMMQRDEIEAQRDEIEHQRDEIMSQKDFVTNHRDELVKANNAVTDSIRYAKRIQQAVVPPLSVLRNELPESFIYFKPRDIVSGDFYWFRKIEDTLVVAVADCTGHGVPGAFMSMLGISMINELIRLKEIRSPSALLEEMRRHTKQSLRQTGRLREPHDGMDIAVLAINMKTKVMQYAGAYSPLYIVRETANSVDDDLGTFTSAFGGAKLFEFKATPNPIGIHVKEEKFKNHVIQLQQGDCVYLFTDGYLDQFGGQFGYKFMAKRFKRLLVQNYEQSMEDQFQAISDNMEDWRHHGKYGQLDDMLVLGFRI